VAIPALLLMVAGLLWLGSFPERPDYLAVLPGLIVLGVGIGAIFPATAVGAMGSISGQELGLGSGIVNMSRQLGFALGVATLVAVFTGVVSDGTPAHEGYDAGFRVAALAALLAIPFAAAMRKKPADVHGEEAEPGPAGAESPAAGVAA
jgi:hypothetical protein